MCIFLYRLCSFFVFFFNDTATTEIYTLSLHDALPICPTPPAAAADGTATGRSIRTRRLPSSPRSRSNSRRTTARTDPRRLSAPSRDDNADVRRPFRAPAPRQMALACAGGEGPHQRRGSGDLRPCPHQIGRASCRERV